MFSKNDEGGLFPLDAFFVRIRHIRPNRTIAESWEEGDGFEYGQSERRPGGRAWL